MSKSEQIFIAMTQGHTFTLYAMMRLMGIPLTEEQAKYQAYLEERYPAIVIDYGKLDSAAESVL